MSKRQVITSCAMALLLAGCGHGSSQVTATQAAAPAGRSAAPVLHANPCVIHVTTALNLYFDASTTSERHQVSSDFYAEYGSSSPEADAWRAVFMDAVSTQETEGAEAAITGARPRIDAICPAGDEPIRSTDAADDPSLDACSQTVMRALESKWRSSNEDLSAYDALVSQHGASSPEVNAFISAGSATWVTTALDEHGIQSALAAARPTITQMCADPTTSP